MLIIYDKDKAIKEVSNELGTLDSDCYTNIYLVGDDVYRAVVNRFTFLPFLDYQMKPSSDYNGYHARMSKLEEKNKSRAKFVNVYRYQVYVNRDKNYAVDLSYSGVDHILLVDDIYLNISMDYRHPVIKSLSLFDDNRRYTKQLPYDYDEKHPKPTAKITVLTDAVIDKWLAHLIEKAKEYDDIMHHVNEHWYNFIQRIEDNIDPTKCEKYEVTEKKGEIVANGLVLNYNIDDDGSLTWGVSIHQAYNINYDNAVSRFIAMTGTGKN